MSRFAFASQTSNNIAFSLTNANQDIYILIRLEMLVFKYKSFKNQAIPPPPPKKMDLACPELARGTASSSNSQKTGLLSLYCFAIAGEIFHWKMKDFSPDVRDFWKEFSPFLSYINLITVADPRFPKKGGGRALYFLLLFLLEMGGLIIPKHSLGPIFNGVRTHP